MAVVEVEVVGAPLEPGADEVGRRRGSVGEAGEGRGGAGRGPVPFPNSPGRQASRRARTPVSWLEPPAPGTVYLGASQRAALGGLPPKETPASRAKHPWKSPLGVSGASL